MADRDPFGLWGGAQEDDKYGIWGEASPSGRPKKRTRSKRPLARDVEAPVSPEPDKEADEDPVAAPEPVDKYGLMPAPEPSLKRGPAPQQKRPGEARTEEPAWYEPLLSSTASFAQGALQNWGDEALAGTVAATDALGITTSGNTYAENQQILKAGADRVTRDYPIGHGAGQMAAGLAASAALPGAGALGVAAQGLSQGALSAASEYGDTRSGKGALLQGALGTVMGAGGAYVGGKAAKMFARSPQAAQDAELEAIKRASRAREPAPGPLPGPAPEPPAPAPDWTVEFPNGRPPSGPPGAAPTPEVPYQLGGMDMTPPAALPSAPQASERELQRIALQRAQNEMTPSPASRGLRGASTLMALGGHPLPAAGLRAASALVSPGVREGALKSGYLVTNPEAAAMTRMGLEGAWELGAPAAYGGKVNAQDALGDPQAMRAAEGWTPTQLSPAEEAKFQRDLREGDGYKQWRDEFIKETGVIPNPDDPENDYDYRGAWKAGVKPSRYEHDGGRYHWASSLPDGRMLKAPDHPTAWMEHFMRRTGKDPGALGLKNEVQGAQYEAEHVAYADQATMNYALSETLHSGQTGLSPKDEQAITDAVVAGDDDVIRATDFRLRQRYPAYARRVERALKSLNEEE